jgi:hypothetical protein
MDIFKTPGSTLLGNDKIQFGNISLDSSKNDDV